MYIEKYGFERSDLVVVTAVNAYLRNLTPEARKETLAEIVKQDGVIDGSALYNENVQNRGTLEKQAYAKEWCITMETGLLTYYSEVKSEPVKWLWYPYIAIGKVTLLQGDPGDGKSTMMMNFIAELSKGGATPDGVAFGRPHKIIYQCSEDGASDTIKPRLEAAGADCRNIAFINEEVHSGLTLDDERIRDAITECRPQLVVIDPIQSYIENDSDLQIAVRARKLMRRIGMWASTFDCAIVLIGHLSKREGTKELYRGLGSIDLAASVRSVLHVERVSCVLCIRPAAGRRS